MLQDAPNPKIEMFIVFAQSIKAMCFENEDIVGAAPTGYALTSSQWSPIWLPSKTSAIFEQRYLNLNAFQNIV